MTQVKGVLCRQVLALLLSSFAQVIIGNVSILALDVAGARLNRIEITNILKRVVGRN